LSIEEEAIAVAFRPAICDPKLKPHDTRDDFGRASALFASADAQKTNANDLALFWTIALEHEPVV
jgi:hypothetical protein